MKTVILTDHTGFCEKHKDIFIHLNKILKDPHEISVAYTNLSNNMMVFDFAIINISEIYGITNAHMIATSIDTASILQKANIKAKKIFYIWDTEFLSEKYDFLEKHDTLSGLALITRSEEDSKKIKNIFNLDSYILPNFELEKIWNLPENTKTK